MNTKGLTINCKVHFQRSEHGARELRSGNGPMATAPLAAEGRVPKLARLMALAIRFDDVIRKVAVKDFAELARVGHVTRARVTQIMNLLNLAPDIQEQIIFMPLVMEGHDPIKEWQVRPVAAEPLWKRQRKMWKTLCARTGEVSR